MLTVRDCRLDLIAGNNVTGLVSVDRWDLAPGECVGLWGPSGVGKTAFLTCVFRPELLRHNPAVRLSGSVSLNFRRPVYLCQSEVLFPACSVRANLYHLSNRKDSGLLMGLLPDKYLTVFNAQFASSPMILSGGERKALIVARAILREPDCIIMDEPFAALDLDSRTLISGALRRYAESRRVTLVLVSHQLEDFLLLSDTVFPLDGRRPAVMARRVDVAEIRRQHPGRAEQMAALFSSIYGAQSS